VVGGGVFWGGGVLGGFDEEEKMGVKRTAEMEISSRRQRSEIVLTCGRWCKSQHASVIRENCHQNLNQKVGGKIYYGGNYAVFRITF